MEEPILKNITWFAPLAGFIFFVLWLKFVYFTIKVHLGIKKILGSKYYLLSNKWPNMQVNSDIRETINSSSELTKFNKEKFKAFKVILIYFSCIIILMLTVALYVLIKNET